MIIKYNEISALCRPCSTDENIANNMILEAENLDIIPQIGILLYNAIIEHSERYVALLDGCTFQDKQGNWQVHQGLKKCVAYYASSRIIRSGNALMTRFGYVVKQDDYSQPADNARISNDSGYLRECAGQMMMSVKAYIEANQDNSMFKPYARIDKPIQGTAFFKVDIIGE